MLENNFHPESDRCLCLSGLGCLCVDGRNARLVYRNHKTLLDIRITVPILLPLPILRASHMLTLGLFKKRQKLPREMSVNAWLLSNHPFSIPLFFPESWDLWGATTFLVLMRYLGVEVLPLWKSGEPPDELSPSSCPTVTTRRPLPDRKIRVRQRLSPTGRNHRGHNDRA